MQEKLPDLGIYTEQRQTHALCLLHHFSRTCIIELIACQLELIELFCVVSKAMTNNRVLCTRQQGILTACIRNTCRGIQEVVAIAPETYSAAAQTLLERSKMTPGSLETEGLLRRLLLLQHSTTTTAAMASTSSAIAGLLICSKLLIGPYYLGPMGNTKQNLLAKTGACADMACVASILQERHAEHRLTHGHAQPSHT